MPSQFFVIAIAFTPVGWVAVTLWVTRSLIGNIDAPARESYTMAIVEPEERVAMAGITGMGRSMVSIFGPTLSTAMWNAFAPGAAFLISGLMRIGYDVGLYFTFRKVKPPEEK